MCSFLAPQVSHMPSAQHFAENCPLARHHALTLPNGPGILVSHDYFEPLPLTPRGNRYILLFTDRFSRLVDICQAQYTVEVTPNILIHQYTTL